MRIGADALGVHHNRSLVVAAPSHGFGHGGVGGDEIGFRRSGRSSDRESGYQLGYVAARGLSFHRDRDRVAIVFDQIDDGQLFQTGEC